MEQQTTLFEFEKKFDWTNYNLSQTREKTMFLKLLYELVSTIPKKIRVNSQNQALNIADIIFSLCLKTYSMKSGRRIISELELAKRSGYIDNVPHFNTVFNYLKNKNITNVLMDLVEVSAMPLASVEKKFAGDSTGVGTKILHDRWSQIRQNYSKHHEYIKLHASFGVLTNIVTTCKVTDANVHDSNILPELVEKTCNNFNVKEFSFDKAYSSRRNLQLIWNRGALPLIPFKKNVRSKARGSMVWKEMYEFFEKNNEEFMKKYHLRSNAESGFFMIKQRFGDLTYMKDKTGMINDVLCKVLSHNLIVLIQEIFILGVDVKFAQFKSYLAQDKI